MKRNLNIIMLVIVYVLFIYIYVNILHVNFNYSFMSFDLNFDTNKLLLIVPITICLLILSMLIKSEFMYCIYVVYLSYIYFPTSIYYMFNIVPFIPTIVAVLFLILLFIVNNIKIKEVKFKPSKSKFTEKQWLYFLFLISVILVIPFVYTYRGSISLENIRFDNIYNVRTELTNLYFPFQGYIQSPLTRIILPILLIMSIEQRNKKMIIYSSTVLFFMFITSALKSTLLLLIIILAFYFARRFYSTVKIYLIGLLLASIYSVIEYVIMNTYSFTDVIIRRVFFIPAMLDKSYYIHFEGNPLWWSYTRIGSILHEDVLYGREVTKYIGTNIVGGENLNANVGMLTEGYISAGFLGSILSIAILVAIFVFFNSINLSPRYFGLIFFYIYVLNTSFFETALLTHGLFYLLLAAPIFMIEKNSIST